MDGWWGGELKASRAHVCVREGVGMGEQYLMRQRTHEPS